MLIAAIETSTLEQGLLLARGREVLGERTATQVRGHSRGLAQALHALLQETGIDLKDIQAFAVNIGPGSFTGLRVGLSLVKGICAVTGAQIIPVSSVRAVASGLTGGARVAVAWDAFNTLVYGCVLDGVGGEPQVPLAAWNPGEFDRLALEAGATLRRGDGWQRYADDMPLLAQRVPELDLRAPTAREVWEAALQLQDAAPGVGQDAIQNAGGVEPIYVRKSAAEEAREARLSQGA